jgi:hypothetical protein
MQLSNYAHITDATLPAFKKIMHENKFERQSNIPVNVTGEGDVGNYLSLFVNQQNRLP